MAGQGQHAPARRRRTARRVLADAHQRPPGGARPGAQERPAPPPRQHAAARDRAADRHHRAGHQYALTVTTSDGAVRTERYRLITTLTDWRACPAAELAACYAWRWAIETGYRECKTYLRGPGRILRGRTPDLARQELWAYLAVYQAIRAIIVRAAAGAGLDPDRISFTATLNAAQRTMTAGPGGLAAALAATETEILSCLVPPREGRVCPGGEQPDLSEIRITGSAAVIEGQRIEGTTKSGRSRTVSIDAETVQVLRDHRKRQAEERLRVGPEWRGADDYVFSTAWGEPIHPDTVSSLMTTLTNTHNDQQSEPLPHARLHDLRHVHATTLLLAGVPVHVVAARLGHADPSITLRVYAHVISDQLTEAADIFARAVAATT